MADAGRNSPDPEINFRRERNFEDLGHGDQIHTDHNDDSDRESILQVHGDEVALDLKDGMNIRDMILTIGMIGVILTCNQLAHQSSAEVALNQLFKVIPIEMKCRCIDKECQTIADAVDVIERYESILWDGDKKKSTIRAVESKDIEGHMSEKDYQSNLQALQDRITKLEQGHGNQDAKRANTGRCYSCNSPDHFTRNCPHKNNQSRARGNFQGSQRHNTSFNNNQGNNRTLAQ
ncbi:unnamed protein product [Mytilus coruscus]|uniref:CCHC-type domain-containing protein n=1 Tax=Mytilus coruscus TaxID=42192 RepID=A0A6J8ABJ5_MYTCO|nr:unnamed protein product [Mytilus coruscus]